MMKSKKSTQMRDRVLGIDPGFDRLGAAVLEGETLLHSSCIVTDRKKTHEKRLLEIGEEISAIISKWNPSALAIETLFFNQNVSSAIKVAEARGVVLYEAGQAGIPVYEYSPQAVKIAVTGYGKAGKSQVELMARKLISIPADDKKLDDELDAIAVGITHLASFKGI